MGQSFLYGALILLAANFFNRIIGFIYQISMMRLLEPEGVGLFNMVYPLYVLVLVAATAGIPVAIAKLVAEEMARNNIAGAYRIFKISLSYIAFLSIFFTLLLIIFAPVLKYHVFPNPKVYYCFLSLVPGVVIVSLCSAFRGFFQGLQRMMPTAVTQITEQTIRVAAGLSIAYWLLPRGVEYAAIGISLGVILGELTGFLLMLGIYLFNRPRINTNSNFYKMSMGGVTVRIFHLAIPVTMTRLVTTGVMSVDAILIPYRLQASGLSISEATAAYGELIGIAMVLVLTPGVITFALATASVPAVADAVALKRYSLVRRRVSETFRITMLAGIPATVILICAPVELCNLFFDYPGAAGVLKALAIGGPFIYISQTTTGILQGLGKPELPLKNLVAGSIVKVTGVYYMTAVPALGVVGTAYALSFSYAVSAFMNYFDLRAQTGLKTDFSDWILKPLFSSFVMIAAFRYFQSLLPGIITVEKLCVMVSLLFGFFVYIVVMYITGGIKTGDLNRVRDIKSIK